MTHELIGLRAGFLAELRVDRDVAAEDRLQAAEEIPHDRARAHADASYYSNGAHDLVARQREAGGDHVVLHIRRALRFSRSLADGRHSRAPCSASSASTAGSTQS